MIYNIKEIASQVKWTECAKGDREESKGEMTCTLGEMIKRIKREPPIPMLYSAIKVGSVGLVYGVAKTGKTIFCENLAMSIASGRNSFLGKPINTTNKKVLFVSFEEFYQGRTSRNIKQMTVFNKEEIKNIENNYFVITENAPQVLSTKEDWNFLRREIEKTDVGTVFIDSLTRVIDGQIESADVAKNAMIALREMARDYNVTLVVIHHSTKIDFDRPMTLKNVAGSRVISQETDFIFGINKSLANTRYLKLVSARYADDSNSKVATFELDDNLWIKYTGAIEELELLNNRMDRRKDDSSYIELINCVKNLSKDGNLVKTGEIKEILVSKHMSEKTMHKHLEKGITNGILENPMKGVYKIK